MDSTAIKETCQQLIDECHAIIKYTDSIESITGGRSAEAAINKPLLAVFQETRHDELSHVQKLAVALTEIMLGDEPETAERMDAKIKGDRQIVIDCWDQDESLQSLLEYIRDNGKSGHSFSIIVDPGDPEREKTFGFDGDGTDQIYTIDVETKADDDGGDDDDES